MFEDDKKTSSRPISIKRSLTNFVQMHKLKDAAQQVCKDYAMHLKQI